MQVMKSLLDTIERQERIDLKRQRKQETSDERVKRMSQQRLDSVLLKHRDNLRKDILKKRSLLEREIANEIHVCSCLLLYFFLMTMAVIFVVTGHWLCRCHKMQSVLIPCKPHTSRQTGRFSP